MRTIVALHTLYYYTPFLASVSTVFLPTRVRMLETAEDNVIIHNLVHHKLNCFECETAVKYLSGNLTFIVTEYFWPKRLLYLFLNNIFNLKGSCVLRTS